MHVFLQCNVILHHVIDSNQTISHMWNDSQNTLYSTLLWLEVLTFPAHVDLETLGEAAGLTLVAASHVHHAAAVLLTDVLQVPTAIYGVT